MKRFALCLLALLALRVEHTGVDIARLQPVELMVVTVSGGVIHVQTDGGASGEGDTLEAAMEQLCCTAPAQVFPDTAEHLLLTKSALPLLPQLQQHLRPACRVCLLEGEADPADALAYLKVHPSPVKLLHTRAEQVTLPVLQAKEDRFDFRK